MGSPFNRVRFIKHRLFLDKKCSIIFVGAIRSPAAIKKGLMNAIE